MLWLPSSLRYYRRSVVDALHRDGKWLIAKAVTINSSMYISVVLDGIILKRFKSMQDQTVLHKDRVRPSYALLR